MNNGPGNNNQQGQGNRRNEVAQRRRRFFTTSPSISGIGNNNPAMFFDNFSSPVVGPRDNRREASMMLPINNNNAAEEIIHIIEEQPDLESSLLEVNVNSSTSILPTTIQNNQPASNLLTLQRNLGINTSNNNNQQDGVSLDLSLHPTGGDGGGTGGATERGGDGGGGGRDGLLMSALNTTSARRIMPVKRTAPDYPRREFTVGESSSAAGGSVAQPMAAPKRRPTANENAVVRISSSSSSSTCTCTPNPTCPQHGSTNNNPPSSSREQRHETTTNNNNNNNSNNHHTVVRVPSSSWSISDLQQALQSDDDSFQVLHPTTTTPPPPPPPPPPPNNNNNNNNNNATLDILQLDDGSFIYPQPVFDSSSHHYHHHHLHHGHQHAPINNSFYHHGHRYYFPTADTSAFGPASINYMENIPHHHPYAGASSSSSFPSPLPRTTVVRPRAAIPSQSLPHRVVGSNNEANNTRNNNLFSSPSRRELITVTHNRGNSSSSLIPSGLSLTPQLLQGLVRNTATPSSESGAAQNNTGTTVGPVPAFRHLTDLARLWIRRLTAHDETLATMSPSSTTDNTPQRALPTSPIAEAFNLPTYFAGDSARLRQEIRSAIQHLRNGGSVRLEELLILDYSIVLNLLNNIQEEEDADLPEFESLGDGQRVTNPDVGLTETEVAACIGREIFQTVAEQPQNIDACGICQEDYVHGEELARLDCAHRYHFSCIKQWLLIKNRCPVCKQMAITIIDLEDDEDDDE